MALRFYACGCCNEPLADMFGVSKSTVCDVIAEVSYLIAMRLKDKYIGAPTDEVGILNAKALFHRIGNFPLIIGAVDGTNIKIESLGGDDAEMYRNRKSYFSINCQLVVAADVCKFFFFS